MISGPQIAIEDLRCSGLYLVSLNNERPISVNADRPKISARCVAVNKNNCKFRKAKNLARRRRDYYKTFGPENVNFHPNVQTDYVDQAEYLISSKLIDYQIRGHTGRLNEWLFGIGFAEVHEIVFQTMRESNIPFRLFTASDGLIIRSSKPATRRTDMGSQYDEVTPGRIVETAQYLKDHNYPTELLRDLHHFEKRTESFASTVRYFSRQQSVRENNRLYGLRLIYVMRGMEAGKGNVGELTAKALELYPISKEHS